MIQKNGFDFKGRKEVKLKKIKLKQLHHRDKCECAETSLSFRQTWFSSHVEARSADLYGQSAVVKTLKPYLLKSNLFELFSGRAGGDAKHRPYSTYALARACAQQPTW